MTARSVSAGPGEPAVALIRGLRGRLRRLYVRGPPVLPRTRVIPRVDVVAVEGEALRGLHERLRHRLPRALRVHDPGAGDRARGRVRAGQVRHRRLEDRKSTRLNSSHQIISYAVFCLKKKKKTKYQR